LAGSTARAKRGLVDHWSGASTMESPPLIIHAFDVSNQVADDFDLVDILVRDHDVRELIFDHDH
jgi:hypothetical protein